MKTLIPHSSNCRAFFTYIDCLVCVIIALTTACWESTQIRQDETLLHFVMLRYTL